MRDAAVQAAVLVDRDDLVLRGADDEDRQGQPGDDGDDVGAEVEVDLRGPRPAL